MQAAEDDSVAFAEHQHTARDPAGNADSDPVGDAEHDAHADAIEHPHLDTFVPGEGVRDGAHGAAESTNAKFDADPQPGGHSACTAVAAGKHGHADGKGHGSHQDSQADRLSATGPAAVSDGHGLDQSTPGLSRFMYTPPGAPC